jgi:hypothetical protein
MMLNPSRPGTKPAADNTSFTAFFEVESYPDALQKTICYTELPVSKEDF